MKRLLLAAALCVSCSTTPTTIKPDKQVVEAFGVKASVERLTAPVSAAPTELPALATCEFKNHSNKPRIQWGKCSVPFQIGVIPNEAALSNLSTSHGGISFYPVKWHFRNAQKHSISIASAVVPLYMQPGETQMVEVFQEHKSNPLPFGFGPNFGPYLGQHSLDSDFLAVMKLQGDEAQWAVAPMFDNLERIQVTDQHMSLRFHQNFIKVGSSEKSPVSMTVYVDIYNRQDFGDMVVSVGNQTFLQAPVGGVNVEYIDLWTKDPMNFKIRKQEKYNAVSLPDQDGYKRVRLIANRNFADAQAHSFRGTWSTFYDKSGLAYDSYLAHADYPLHGVADFDSWNNSLAAGIHGRVQPLRITKAAMKTAVADKCNPQENVWIDAHYYPAYISTNPSQAGDQTHFSGNIANPQLWAIQSGSDCTIQHMLHNMQVATYRPSYYFKDGHRMRWSDSPPSTWFWSGRIHYHPGQNQSTNPWQYYVNKNLGNFYEWKGEDDQHYGETNLRAFWEMTGDAFAKDLLIYRQTLAMWNKLGDGHQRAFWDSERSVRTKEDALQLVRYFPDAQHGVDLKDRLIRAVAEVHKVQSDYAMSTYGFAGWEYVRDDNRWPNCFGTTPGATNILGAPFEVNGCITTWWTGFHLGWLKSMDESMGPLPHARTIMTRYFNAKDFYWNAQGLNEGHGRVNNWNYPENGAPFTQYWHAGWVSAILYANENGFLPANHSAFYLNTVIPAIRASIGPGTWSPLGDADRWWQ